jgi:protein ImuA
VPAALPIDLSASPAWKDVWRGGDCVQGEAVIATGHPALDAQLPGGGWPLGSVIEVLQQREAQHAWQLLLPALAQAVRERTGPVVLVDAPLEPFGPSLQAQGLPLARLLQVRAGKATARLWAAEQALRCADVVAVLAWLPQVRNAELRRLHLAAQQHGRLLFVFRGMDARNESSPARLRLAVDGVDDLRVRILKRRGPPLQAPLVLPAHPARLAALLRTRSGRGAVPTPLPRDRSHVLDRIALPA